MTGLQLPGVIDELCFYDGPLGARVSDEGTSIDVWAPTAQQVIASSLVPCFCVHTEYRGLGLLR